MALALPQYGQYGPYLLGLDQPLRKAQNWETFLVSMASSREICVFFVWDHHLIFRLENDKTFEKGGTTTEPFAVLHSSFVFFIYPIISPESFTFGTRAVRNQVYPSLQAENQLFNG